MKKEDIGSMLVILMFVIIGFAYFIGWTAIENQNIISNSIKVRQYALAGRVNSLRDSLFGLKKRSENMTANLGNIDRNLDALKTALGNNEITIKEAFSRIDDISERLAMWQADYNGLVSRLDKLSNEVKLSRNNNKVKKVNLGKVSVEKKVVQNLKNKVIE